MASKKARSDEDRTEAGYPRRYWWLVLIVVPVAIALIQYAPWQRAGSAAGNSTSITVGDVSIIVSEATQAGAPLGDELVKQLHRAVEQSQNGQHAAAAAALERVRSASGEVAALPALQVSLADEYRLAGREDESRRAYRSVLEKDATNERAIDGLGRLPDAPLEGLQLVNFTSQRENIWGDGVASNTVDGNPASAWVSRDGQFPQTFVFALPMGAAISEISFNNPAYGDPDRGAKDIEIAVSSQSASSGFDVVAKAALAKNDIGQGIRLKSSPTGRWIKVRVLSNHGNKDATTLGDVSVIGKPRPGRG